MAPLKSRSAQVSGSHYYPVTNQTTVNTADSLRQDLWVSVGGPRGDKPFESSGVRVSGGTVSPGTIASGRTFSGDFPSNSYVLGKPMISLPSYPADEANLWAASNPSRPAVHLPVFWLELREIPDMLRQAGRFLLHVKKWKHYVRLTQGKQSRDLATANLAFQFGWMPLYQDLWKIVSFQDAVEKRRKEINRLHSGKGLYRRLMLNSASDDSVENVQILGVGGTSVRQDIFHHRSTERWGVCRWKPSEVSSLPPSDGTLRAHLTAIHPSHILENVWEALPWSWMIDYFTNVGDIIQANNHYLAKPAGGSIMTRSTVTSYTPATKVGTGIIGACSRVAYTHSRSVTYGASSLDAFIPNLGWKQLSVLASLTYLKRPLSRIG